MKSNSINPTYNAFKTLLVLATATSLSCLFVEESIAETGLTQSQANTLDGIRAHCKRARGISDSLSPQQLAWADSCWALETTANRINDTGGPTGFAIDDITNNEELGQALDETSQFEVLSQMRGAVESASGQFANIGARLEALKLGATGITIAGLSPATMGSSSQGGAAGDSDDAGKLGGFLNGNFVFGDRDRTDRQEGFDFDSQGVTLGADYRFTDEFVLGGAFGYTTSDVDIDASGGDLETETYSVSAFSIYYIDSFYINALFNYAWNDYDSTRRIVYPSVDTVARGETNGEQYAINLGGGYKFNINELTLDTHARVQFLHADIDSYGEQGSGGGHDLTLADQTIESLLTSIGGRINYAFSTPVGVIVPQVRFEWNHEFENDTRIVKARYTYDPFNTVLGIPTDSPDRDYFTLGASLSATFSGGVSGFIDYQTLLGLKQVTTHLITAGIRAEF